MTLPYSSLVRVDENAARDALPVGTKDDVVATVFAVAFLQKRIADLEGQKDVVPWVGMYKKAKEFVGRDVEDLDALVARIIGML